MSAPPNTDLRPGELAGSGVPLEQILDGVSDAVITVCSDWTMRWANANGARLLGIERGEVAGRNIAHFPGVFADGLRTACVDALSGGNPTVLEQHLDKPASWFQIRILPLNGSLVLYFHDLIDRKRV